MRFPGRRKYGMDRRHAVILAFLITLLLASTLSLTSEESIRETTIVARVIDGDTFVSHDDRTFRLVNINAPEKDSSLSSKATAFLKHLENTSIELEILGADKYHRELVRIYNGSYLNAELVRKGLASKFLVQADEIESFAALEAEARAHGRGIWQPSPLQGCLSITVDARKETVLFTTTCTALNQTEWYLKDESRKIYKFTTPFEKITLHSGSGTDNTTDRYWGTTEVWNNDRDTAYVFDERDQLVSTYMYGY